MLESLVEAGGLGSQAQGKGLRNEAGLCDSVAVALGPHVEEVHIEGV